VFRVIGLIAMSLCAGCASVGRLDKGIPAPTEKESIFVLGVAPENHRVMIFGGDTDTGFFKQNWLPAAFYGGAEGGFIVGKAKAGSTLAITDVRVTENGKSILGLDFIPCDGAKTVVFEAPAGKVTYLGSVNYEVTGNGLRIEYWNDLDAARAYVAGAYPALSARLEQGGYKLLPVMQPCTSTNTVYVPVYVPR
jgi:hypothetical protein